MAASTAVSVLCVLWLLSVAEPFGPTFLSFLPVIGSRNDSVAVTSCTGDGEFLCADGAACLPGPRRCDGTPDCGDQSDEANCTTSAGAAPAGEAAGSSGLDIERTKDNCMDRGGIWCSNLCIPRAWRCDDEVDCADGSDELNCNATNATCGPGRFPCHDGPCLAGEWQCDGEEDCPSGDDELNCTLSEVQSCGPGLFQCNNSSCIDAVNVCNGKTDCADGSDEGAGCSMPDRCRPSSCDPGKLCRPTPSGHLCLCPAGQTFSSSGGCLHRGPCAAGCEHDCQQGSCICPTGLVLSYDNRTCVLSQQAVEPALLMADDATVHQLQLRTMLLRVVAAQVKGRRVLAVAGDLASHSTVYWSYFLGRSGVGSVRRRAVLSEADEAFVQSGVEVANALAWEWVARVLYLADSGRRHLAACDWLGHCSVVVRNLLGRPLALAVVPQKRTLLWTEANEGAGRILSVGLDGERPDIGVSVIAEAEMPSSLAVDVAANRVFWADTSRWQIESCRLDGSDRRAVPELVVRQPFSVVVLGQHLVWSDVQSEKVHSCDKITGKNRTIVYRHPEVGSLQLSALHVSLQPPLPNPCAGVPCSHLCLLSPIEQRGFRCLCAEHMRLGSDGFTCHHGNATHLVVAGSDRVLSVTVHVLGKDAVTPLDWLSPRDVTAVALDYLPLDGGPGAPLDPTLLYADAGTGKILRCGIGGSQRQLVTDTNATYVTAIATDPVRENVYWAECPSRSGCSLFLSRVDGRYRRLVVGFPHYVTALAVSVGQRHLFAAMGGRAGSIQRMALDGTGRVELVTSDMLTVAAICTEDASGRLFWSDSHRGVIESVRYDGSDRLALKRHLAAPAGLALAGGFVFWTDLTSPNLHWVGDMALGSKFSQPLELSSTEDTQRVLRLSAAGPDRQAHAQRLRAISRCRSLRCPQLCVPAVDGEETCACGDGLRWNKNTRTCNSAACGQDEFRCRSGECIPVTQRCDGVPDCAAADDETACLDSEVNRSSTSGNRSSTCTPLHFNCSSGERCVASTLRCDGVRHCSDGSDERNCSSGACADDQFRCGTGFCVIWQHVCDAFNDCTDGSDEQLCDTAPCPNDTFACRSSGRCIPEKLVCDQVRDCADGSDEPPSCQRPVGSPPPCGAALRRCADGGCVGATLWCDGVADCSDGSDEGPACGTAAAGAAGSGGATSSSDDQAPSSGAVVAILLCVTALLLAGLALWLRRRRCRRSTSPGQLHQFHNPTYGQTPPSVDQPPQPWFEHDDNINNNSRIGDKPAPGTTEPVYDTAEMGGGHVELGLGARSQDSGFLELGNVGFSSKQPLLH